MRIQNANSSVARGFEEVKAENASAAGLICAQILPPWRSITSLAMDNPNPVPSFSIFLALLAR